MTLHIDFESWRLWLGIAVFCVFLLLEPK